MRQPASGRFVFSDWLPLLLAAGLLLALFAYATAPGLGGTSDSRYYLHAARTWRETGLLLHPDGTAYRYWPPLFPLLLSGAHTLLRLRLLHAAALLGTLFFWSAVGRRLLPARRAAALPLLLAFSASTLVLSRFVWSETVFGFLWAGYVWALLRWLRTGSWLDFGLSAGLGCLLPLQHSLGLFLLAGTYAALLLLPRPAVVPGRARRLLHGLLSGAGALLWQMHVWPLPGPAGAYVNLGAGQLLNSAADYGFVLLRWLLPLAAGWRAAVPAALWAAGLLALLAALWPRQRATDDYLYLADNSADNLDLAGAARRRLVGLRLLWAAALATLLLLLPATMFSRSGAGIYDAERYATVLYPVLLLLVLHGWPASGPAAGPLARVGSLLSWRGLSRALLLLWVLYAGLRTAHNARQLHGQKPTAAWLPR